MMSKRVAFGGRPVPAGEANDWVRGEDTGARRTKSSTLTHSARLTIDVTPELRGRIKVEAFRRGDTVATLLRDLLEREFPPAALPDGSS